MRIWKYPLQVTDKQTITMPKGSRILSCQTQGDGPVMWALCSEKNVLEEPEERTFIMFGTGEPMMKVPGDYIGTVQVRELVWHFFEAK